MKYHRPLPSSFRDLLIRKDVDIVNIAEEHKLIKHRWVVVPTNDVVTDEGCEWFKKNNIPLSKYVAVFKLEKFYNGPIHVDAPPQKFGFNFVVCGQGEMQWVDFDGEPEETVWAINGWTSEKYHTFHNVTNVSVIESWSGTDGIVRVDVPHRVLGSDSDRYAVSVRPDWQQCNYTFDEVIQILGL